jgi:hypothetical protein
VFEKIFEPMKLRDVPVIICRKEALYDKAHIVTLKLLILLKQAYVMV